MNGKDSPMITNCWGEAKTVRLEAPETIIQPAVAGRAYHHHQHVVTMDGTLYASFSSGARNEDDVGQCVMFASSADRGATWTEPRPVVVPPPGRYAPCVVTATGLHARRAAAGAPLRLMAYYGQYEYAAAGLDGAQRKPADAAHMNTACYAVYSDDGGETWSAPAKLLDRFVANLGPQPANHGRLIMPGSVVYPSTDDPGGLVNWTWRALPCLPADHVDDSAGFQRCLRERKREHGYCEGSMFVTDDGAIHMMLRTNERYLAHAQSVDNGETWSLPEPTEFTDNSSRHQFGRLPDGRFFALTTPDPDHQWRRTPLVLAVSEDGIVFDRHFVVGDAPGQPPRFDGMHKGGRYGYPYLAVCDDTVVVLYSINKEDVAAACFPVDALS